MEYLSLVSRNTAFLIKYPLYRKQSMWRQGFLEMLLYLLAKNLINFIAGDFNYELILINYEICRKKFFRRFHCSVQIVNEPINISESRIDH